MDVDAMDVASIDNEISDEPQMSNDASDSASATPPPPPPAHSKTLAEFLSLMDNYQPLIPDAVTDYYCTKSGLDTTDIRMFNFTSIDWEYKRLIALCATKFISDVSQDAFQYSKIRQKDRKMMSKEKKTVLTMEDLSSALCDYGINVKRPDYYS